MSWLLRDLIAKARQNDAEAIPDKESGNDALFPFIALVIFGSTKFVKKISS